MIVPQPNMDTNIIHLLVTAYEDCVVGPYDFQVGPPWKVQTGLDPVVRWDQIQRLLNRVVARGVR